MNDIGWLQWPAMLTTVAASWWVTSDSAGKRKAAFWIFLLSNLLWVIWGWVSAAPALVLLQLALAVINIRGARKASSAEKKTDAQPSPEPRA